MGNWKWSYIQTFLGTRTSTVTYFYSIHIIKLKKNLIKLGQERAIPNQSLVQSDSSEDMLVLVVRFDHRVRLGLSFSHSITISKSVIVGLTTINREQMFSCILIVKVNDMFRNIIGLHEIVRTGGFKLVKNCSINLIMTWIIQNNLGVFFFFPRKQLGGQSHSTTWGLFF